MTTPKEINLFEEVVIGQEREADDYIPEGMEQYQVPIPLDPQKREQVKRIMEAILFASSEPISFNKIREVVDAFYPLKPRQIHDILQELEREYIVQQRSFRLEHIANGYLLRTNEEYRKYIDLLYRDKRAEKLTQASMEVLAIIAYRQPITRPQIEAIRGVDSSGVVQALLDRGLIEVQGRLEAPGRPTLYGITKDFLKHFGLRGLEELPKLDT
jgi:segregation and condensation protein B